MRRLLAYGAAVAALAAAYGNAEGLFVKVYYGDSPEKLGNTSFVPYARFDDFALGEVTGSYLSRLRADGFRVDVLANDVDGKAIWAVAAPAAALPPSAEIAATLPGGSYVVITADADDVIVPGGMARRLMPIAVDWSYRAAVPSLSPAPDEVADVVAAVNGVRYENTVNDLAAFGTRYAYSTANKDAGNYVEGELSAAGLTVHRDRFFGEDLHRVCAASPTAAWAGSVGGMVARTTDGGQTWETLGTICDGEITSIFAFSASRCWVGSTTGEIFYTLDGGENWTGRDFQSGRIASITFHTDQLGWTVTTDGNVWRTTDGGGSWDKVAAVGVWLRDVAFRDANHGVMCGSEGYLARTSDGGAHWSTAASGTQDRIHAVAYRNAVEIYAVGEGGFLSRSLNDGASWTRINAGVEEYFRDVSFAGGVGFVAVGYSGVLRTADGTDWSLIESAPYVMYSVSTPAAGNVWCGSSGGALLHYDDGEWQDEAAHADLSSPYVWENVWARKGTGNRDAVVISGHYDSINLKESSPTTPDAPAPGADDNATGAAAVIEMARAFRFHSFRNDVVFVAFNGEERGLLGAHHFTGALAGDGARIIGNINVDMLGYVDQDPETLDVIYNDRSAWLAEAVRRAATAYAPACNLMTTRDDFMIYSDHSAFWTYGYAAFVAIEDWDTGGVNYPYIHTANDTPDKLDFVFAVNNVRGMTAGAAYLAEPTTTTSPGSLGNLEVYPNPYRPDVHAGYLYFANIPPHSEIVFYNLAGQRVLEVVSGNETIWPLPMETDAAFKSSGVYIYMITTPAGDKTTGKLAVIQ